MEKMDMIQGIANIMSTATILSCLFLKVPQIMYIKQKKSAEGIYVQALVMEITGFTIMSLYNFTNHYSIMTYLEYPIILAQIYVMFFYVLKYKGLLHNSMVPVATVTYWAIVLGYTLEYLPRETLAYVVPLCTPLSGFAKVTYIYGIVSSQNADAVSLTTWVISVSTNLARIFTIYVDSADLNLITNFFISTCLSTGVLFTAMHYQKESALRRSQPQRRKSSAHHAHSD